LRKKLSCRRNVAMHKSHEDLLSARIVFIHFLLHFLLFLFWLWIISSRVILNKHSRSQRFYLVDSFIDDLMTCVINFTNNGTKSIEMTDIRHSVQSTIVSVDRCFMTSY